MRVWGVVYLGALMTTTTTTASEAIELSKLLNGEPELAVAAVATLGVGWCRVMLCHVD